MDVSNFWIFVLIFPTAPAWRKQQQIFDIQQVQMDELSRKQVYNIFQVLERSYPRDPPHIEPPPYNKEMVYENNHHIFEVVDDDAIRVSAEESYLSYTSLVRYF